MGRGQNLGRLFLTGVLLAFFLIGCNTTSQEASVQPPPPLPRKPRVAKTKAQEGREAGERREAYTYDPAGRRDPFKPLIEPKKVVVEKKEEEIKIVSPLQEYDLSSLTLVGIIWGELGKRAMIRTPDGRGYTVTENTPIGKGRSRVLQITPDGVVIEVISKDRRGKLVRETVVMALRKEEG